MAIAPYLAMTAAEFAKRRTFSGPVAWMACHFSPYGTGLSNLPTRLPEGSLLIVNDRTPARGHDPAVIAGQLFDTVNALKCDGILLDFQREDTPRDIVRAVAALPCPVGVSEAFAAAQDRAVFLPPPPLTVTPEAYLAPWQGRELWLEAATYGCALHITPAGSTPGPEEDDIPCPHTDSELFCRYGMAVQEDQITFRLRRDLPQLVAWMEACAGLGVSRFIGLYQQLGEAFSQPAAQDTARFQL